MYTQVAEQWLENEPRMTPLQRSFLEKAAGYYEDFARERGTDPAVRREAALAYRRIGDIRRKLGEYPLAEAAYRRAQEIQAGLAAPPRSPRIPARPRGRLQQPRAAPDLDRAGPRGGGSLPEGTRPLRGPRERAARPARGAARAGQRLE